MEQLMTTLSLDISNRSNKEPGNAIAAAKQLGLGLVVVAARVAV